MKHRGVVILLLVFGLLVSASSCLTGPVPEGTDIGGVDVLFAYDDQPPQAGKTIYEGDDVVVSYYLINTVPRPISNAELCVWDLVSDFHGGIQGEQCRNFNLNKANEYDEEIIPFETEMNQVIGQPYLNVEDVVDTTTIYLDLEYSLRTRSVANMCLISDIHGYTGSYDCPNEFTLTEGNGLKNDFAPLFIDRIVGQNRKQGVQNKLVFEIHLRKSDAGKFVDLASGKPRFGISLALDSLNGSFTCRPVEEDDKIEMLDSTKQITCTSSLITLGNTTENHALLIDFDYTYNVVKSRGPIKVEVA